MKTRVTISLLITVFLISMLSSCTKWGYVDTGISKDHKDKNMYAYFQTDNYNWKLVREMVDKAGLKSMFDGTDTKYAQIMFMGPVDNSVRKWMYDHNYKTVAEVPADLCKKLIQRYTFTTLYDRETVPVGEFGTGDNFIKGGIILTAVGGNKVWFYAKKDFYQPGSSTLITSLYSYFMDNAQKGFIASSNIYTKNGVVHSLDDTHRIGELPM